MSNKDVNIGSQFNYWTVLGYSTDDYKLIVMCKCGKVKKNTLPAMLSGISKSCGCMPKPKKNYNGIKINKLTVICDLPNENKKRKVLCKCDCGKEVKVDLDSLKRNKIKSCGCFYKNHNITHGLYNHKLYNVWIAMINRCYNEKCREYRWYGARGISVCDRWRYSISDFISDIGMQPTPKHTIDRIDTNGNYEPSNFRWATIIEQQKNRRSNVFLEYNNEKMILADWARKFKIRPSSFGEYINKHGLISTMQHYYKRLQLMN
jgi:hypothetical protein